MASIISTSIKISAIMSESLYHFNNIKQNKTIKKLNGINSNNNFNNDIYKNSLSLVKQYMLQICSSFKNKLENTLFNIKNFSPLEETTIIIALIYLDKVIKNNNSIMFNNYIEFYNYFIGCLLLAIKYNQDNYIIEALIYFSNINISELYIIEHSILNIIKYNLYVSSEELNLYYKNIKKMKTDF